MGGRVGGLLFADDMWGLMTLEEELQILYMSEVETEG